MAVGAVGGEGTAIIVWGWMGRTRGSERLSGCVLKRLTPIIAPKRERAMESERGVGAGGRR